MLNRPHPPQYRPRSWLEVQRPQRRRIHPALREPQVPPLLMPPQVEQIPEPRSLEQVPCRLIHAATEVPEVLGLAEQRGLDLGVDVGDVQGVPKVA